MTRIRKRTAQRLKESQNTAAFLTTFNEVDMSSLLDFRKKNKEAVLEKHGVKLGLMGSMARASVLALKEVPAVNASIENDDTIVYRNYVDLSVAASIPKGLVTPVLRNIESMSILQIEQGIAQLVKKVRSRSLAYEERINTHKYCYPGSRWKVDYGRFERRELYNQQQWYLGLFVWYTDHQPAADCSLGNLWYSRPTSRGQWTS